MCGFRKDVLTPTPSPVVRGLSPASELGTEVAGVLGIPSFLIWVLDTQDVQFVKIHQAIHVSLVDHTKVKRLQELDPNP